MRIGPQIKILKFNLSRTSEFKLVQNILPNRERAFPKVSEYSLKDVHAMRTNFSRSKILSESDTSNNFP